MSNEYRVGKLYKGPQNLPEESVSVLPLKCHDCETEWSVTFHLPMEVSKFAAELSKIRCPNCGSKEARLKDKVDLEQEETGKT